MKSNTSWSSTWLKGMQACPKFLLAFFLTFAFLLPPDLTAQTFYGAISGTVTDPSGSLIPNATVTAINPATNEKHSVTTGTEGEYRIVSLLPAPYKLEVIAPSFKRFVQDIVTVQVGTTTTLNAKLEVGATTETIEVNTEAPLLQTESGSVGSQVEGKVVQEMPLNGRNVMNLLALVPGVVPEQNTQGAPAINGGIHLVTSGWGNYSIGGGIANESTQYIDGAPNNVMGGNPPALIMTQDMVQEFKVESNSVSAEYGHFGGGVVNMTSKSGTNAFHGGLYEYVRNTVLNTNDFISKNSGLKKAPYHQNQYGAIVGGPIKRDKAFFQFSWEDQSIHYSSGKQQYVPTLAERGEDSDNFPGGAAIKNALHDDDGKIATACGTTTPAILSGYDTADGYEAFIPESCIDGVAKIMKGYYAYPNTSLAGGAVNYVNQPLSGADSYQYNTRIDYAVSDKQRIFGRWTKWNIMTIAEDDFKGHEGHDPAVPSDYGANKNTTNNLVVGDTYTFNANTIGDLRLSYMRDHFKNFGSAFDSYDVSKLPGDWSIIAPQLGHKGTPAFGPLIGAQESGPWDIPVAAAQVDVYQAFGFNASLTKIVGRHSFKVGEETQLRIHGGIGNGAPFGSQAFFLPNVGDTWGAFMLGDLTNITIANVNETNTINWSHGAYLADTWRVNPKLTINYGIHWEYPGGIYEKKNRATVFLPDAYDSTNGTTASSPYPYLPVNLPGALALANSSMYPSRDLSTPKWDLFSPRFSFAYSLKNDMVVRGGYSLSYLPPDMPTGLMAYNSAVNTATTICNGTGPGSWSHPFTCVNNKIVQPLGNTDQNPGHIFYNKSSQSTVTAPVPNSKFPYMQQWNLSFGKQWKGNIETDISYAGSKGTKLPSSSAVSLDQLPSQYLYMGASALAETAPCDRLGGWEVTVGTCLQPFPQYNGIFDTGANNGDQSYNALYLTFAKRFRTGGVLNVNYTRSHTVGNTDQPGNPGGGAIQNFYNMAAEKSISSFDVPNRMIINYVLDLPFGKGQRWLNQGGVANAVVGGWQVQGITTEQSGFPYSFTYARANQNFFQGGGPTPNNIWGAGTARPDLLPGCNLKTSDSWYQKFQKGTFFNSACLVPAGTTSPTATQNDQQQLMFGNAPRNSDAVRSQFLDNFDFSLSKSTKVWETTSLLFKAEFFNLFNHTVFANANAALSGGGYDTVQGLQFPTVNPQRVIQLSMRLNF